MIFKSAGIGSEGDSRKTFAYRRGGRRVCLIIMSMTGLPGALRQRRFLWTRMWINFLDIRSPIEYTYLCQSPERDDSKWGVLDIFFAEHS